MAKNENSKIRIRVRDEAGSFLTDGYRPGRQQGIVRDSRTGQFILVTPPKGGTSGHRTTVKDGYKRG